MFFGGSMTLIATSNEDPRKLGRIRERLGPLLQVAPKPLSAGDYTFDAHGKTVGIEVKWSLGDLLDSLKVQGESTGTRLGIEVRKLVAQTDIPILLIPPLRARGDGMLLREYSNTSGSEVTGWEYSSVKGILTDVALCGVIIDEWDGDMPQRLAQLYFVMSKQEHGWLAQRGRPEFITLDPTYRQAVWSLCSADKVGPETSKLLLAEFGDLRTVMNQDEKALQRVKGVGPIVAKSIIKMATERF